MYISDHGIYDAFPREIVAFIDSIAHNRIIDDAFLMLKILTITHIASDKKLKEMIPIKNGAEIYPLNHRYIGCKKRPRDI